MNMPLVRVCHRQVVVAAGSAGEHGRIAVLHAPAHAVDAVRPVLEVGQLPLGCLGGVIVRLQPALSSQTMLGACIGYRWLHAC